MHSIAQQLPDHRQIALLPAAGQKPVMTYPLKPWRQRMQQQPADKLLAVQLHVFTALTACPPVILVLKRHLSAVEGQQPLIGNGHAMCVAAQVLQDMTRSAEGRFGIDDPFDLSKPVQPPGKPLWFSQRLDGATELQFAPLAGSPQRFQQQRSEPSAQDANAQEKAGPGWNPAGVIRTQAAAGDDAMHMGMES